MEQTFALLQPKSRFPTWKSVFPLTTAPVKLKLSYDSDVVISCQDILEGGNLRNALQELQQIIITPIKAYSPPTAAQTASDTTTSPSDSTKTGTDKEPAPEGFQSNNPPPCDGDSSGAPISDGDIAGQFTRVMGKGKNTVEVLRRVKVAN